MSRFYNRLFELLVNDSVIIPVTTDRQFRCTFNIKHETGGGITYADIAIYNLAHETSVKAFPVGALVGFKAGYVDAIDYIFRGRIINAYRERSGSDIITRLLCTHTGSGGTKSINKTLGASVTLSQIIREVCSSIGLPVVMNDEDFSSISPYVRGKVLYGDPLKYLNELSQAHGFWWVIENEKIIISGKGKFRNGQPYLINEFTGMEGIPTVTDVGVDVSIRLNPAIKMMGRINLQSQFRSYNFGGNYFREIPQGFGNGIYRVFKIVHTGDSYGDDWTTTITGYR